MFQSSIYLYSLRVSGVCLAQNVFISSEAFLGGVTLPVHILFAAYRTILVQDTPLVDICLLFIPFITSLHVVQKTSFCVDFHAYEARQASLLTIANRQPPAWVQIASRIHVSELPRAHH